jgi:hypothetical protein
LSYPESRSVLLHYVKLMSVFYIIPSMPRSYK